MLKILTTIIIFAGLAEPLAMAQNRDESLAYLRGLKAQNQNYLAELDKKIQTLLSDSALEPLRSSDLSRLEKELQTLSGQRNEHRLRQVFLDRLSLQIDSHYRSGEMREFMQVRLLEMAKADLTQPLDKDSMWKFLTYLSHAVRDLPERNENIMSFVEGYLKFSTIANPRQPREYLKARNYTNGQESVAASPVPREKVGEVVESRLQRLEKLELRATVEQKAE